MYKALVIGCGNIGGGNSVNRSVTHGGVYKDHRFIQLVAGIDSNPTRAEKFGKAFDCAHASEVGLGIKLYKPDIVSICTPDTTHFKVIREVLMVPTPPRLIFLEKPACSSKSQYDEILQILRSIQTAIVVNHSRRFNSDIIALRKRILSHEFGRILKVRSLYYSGWMHNGTHIVDTVSFLLNDTIRIDRINKVLPSPFEGDPTLELTASLEKSSAELEISSIDQAIYQIFELDFWFQGGRLRLEDFGERILFEQQYLNDIGERVLQRVPTGLPYRSKTAMEEAVDKIVDYLITGNIGRLIGYRFEDTIETMETIWEGQRHLENTKSWPC
jgi:predicted dehydrogenase